LAFVQRCSTMSVSLSALGISSPVSSSTAVSSCRLERQCAYGAYAVLSSFGSAKCETTRPSAPAALREVTSLRVVRPHADKLSPEMTAMTSVGLAQLHSGSEYLVELGFDGELQSQQADFRPLLPLVFRW
jgi:hypothetical protein